MNTINYIFFEEFKSLEKLCGEIYNSKHGVTDYIDDMKSKGNVFPYQVPRWNSDLEELIRLRHIRNHLAHTEGAFNERICSQDDIDSINLFVSRIKNQTDPLALLHKYLNQKRQETAARPKTYNSSTTNLQSGINLNYQSNANLTNKNQKSKRPVLSAVIAIIIIYIIAIGFILLKNK